MCRLIGILGKTIKTFKNWPVCVADYFKLVNGNSVTLVLRNGVRCKIRPGTSDAGVVRDLWFNKFYTPDGFEIADGDTVLDIGAHIGTFSVFASRLNKKGKIYAFEPVPENFRMMKENIKINKAENIVPVNRAMLGDGKREIFLCSENTAQHSFYSDIAKGKKLTVESVSLETFIKRNGIKRIDFLKMDCEGSEYEILFNCPNNVLRMIKKISMEYHDLDGKRNARQMKAFLERKGFKARIRTENCDIIYAKR